MRIGGGIKMQRDVQGIGKRDKGKSRVGNERTEDEGISESDG